MGIVEKNILVTILLTRRAERGCDADVHYGLLQRCFSLSATDDDVSKTHPNTYIQHSRYPNTQSRLVFVTRDFQAQKATLSIFKHRPRLRE